MVDVIPAILPKDFSELEEELARLVGIAPLIQIDLVGQNVLTGQEALPGWEDADFECDIMLSDPAREVATCLAAGAARVVVHAAAATAPQALERLQQTRTGQYPVPVGVALQSFDTPEALTPFVDLYDYVQVMGIERIGSQGQPHDPRSLALVKALRAAHPELVIQVDGAVAPHVREFAAAGANRLVVGSAIVRAQNPKKVFRTLYTEANGS